ncbi:MAG: 2-succinyl-5-enolpyruvyl-6-hydroxy-3-cyclohexene-1-carboxylic-acid synthase [Verrucomicrobiae bacterium]|nr:2-succinyl-5-enolpyruvyl-6-hydroxy-3-cyclohexene-1-carboxylic-acid synthase [Verrucomicrobiae bacterium]
MNAALAAITIEESVAWGVLDFVVCTGARNAPLVVPLLQAPPPIRIWNHFDERAAGFFALGLAKRDRRPVAVVTTSGTAVAELLPAVIEAHYSGLPLVLITADRPKRFRSTGAPQAIEQAHLFGRYCEGCLDVEAAEDFPIDFPWNRQRPLQVNPCFEEPRPEDSAPIDWERALARGAAPFEAAIQPSSFGDPTLLDRFVADFGDGVVLLGEVDRDQRPEVESFLSRLGAPIWAEASSGLRESALLSPFLLPGGDQAFQTWCPGKVLRIGGVPSLRFWRDLEVKPQVPVLSVTRTGFPGLARPCEVTGWLDFSEPTIESCHSETDRPTISESDWTEFPRSEPAMIHALSEIIPPEARVFLGNSLPIREWNLAATRGVPHPDVFANRGANGIDGEVSTFLGLSEGCEEAWGIFGDLTTLYDANAPWTLGQLTAGKRRIVVINNGGGRIFSRLPALSQVGAEEKVVTENRHSLSFEPWAAMWGVAYLEV